MSPTLPKYAQDTIKSRLVKIVCTGKCCCTRWAEMNVDFPGLDVLKKARFGKYMANCLKCGKEALDSDNWYR